MKYIRHSLIGIITWPARSGTLSHKEMAGAIAKMHDGRILSAGFVMLLDGKVRCFGDSGSLNIGGLPDDSDVLQAQMCGG